MEAKAPKAEVATAGPPKHFHRLPIRPADWASDRRHRAWPPSSWLYAPLPEQLTDGTNTGEGRNDGGRRVQDRTRGRAGSIQPAAHMITTKVMRSVVC